MFEISMVKLKQNKKEKKLLISFVKTFTVCLKSNRTLNADLEKEKKKSLLFLLLFFPHKINYCERNGRSNYN